MKRTSTITTARSGTLTALLALTLLAGCGASDGADSEGAVEAPDYSKTLAAAPPELKRLYENDSLLPGGRETYEAQLADLNGYPIVVNHWASWCGPCREEFPYFQAQAAENLDEVAFLGVDSQDSDDAATTFFESQPLPYPSITDPDGEFDEWVDTALVGIPNTLFYDREGELAYVKQGPYSDEAELAADIEKFSMTS